MDIFKMGSVDIGLRGLKCHEIESQVHMPQQI
jgi:hypothetical protein